MKRKLDALREFLISYPYWDEFNILPPKRRFLNLADISMEWFSSASDVAQLALEPTGGDIIRMGADPVWSEDINGNIRIKRQENFILHLLQHSGTNGERADTGEFLMDFKLWLDEMNVRRKAPLFGDDPLEERTWATQGAKVAEWEGQPPASVYAIQLHKIYVVRYPDEDW